MYETCQVKTFAPVFVAECTIACNNGTIVVVCIYWYLIFLFKYAITLLIAEHPWPEPIQLQSLHIFQMQVANIFLHCCDRRDPCHDLFHVD